MKTKLELLGRTLLIFCTTILIGSIFSAMYMTSVNYYSGSANFMQYFGMGIIITAIYSIPTLFILFIGFYLIYKRCKNNRQKWQYITLIWLLTCYGPVFIIISFLRSQVPDEILLIFASIPYVFISFISIFSSTYFFDKRKPPIFQKVKEVMDDDILDAPF